jgi:hypothetical protein
VFHLLLLRVYRFIGDAGTEIAMERWLKIDIKTSQDQQKIHESLWIIISSYVEVMLVAVAERSEA